MQRALDQIDYNLIEVLQKNARLTNKELAARVHLSPSRCFERARRLREQGVLTGFRTYVAPASIGVGLQALVAVRLKEHTETNLTSFEEHTGSLPEVVGVCHLTGDTDFLLRLAVRDTTHLRRITMKEIANRPEVAGVEGPVDDHTWHADNSPSGRLPPLTDRRANGYGLYGMLGGAWEWSQDGSGEGVLYGGSFEEPRESIDPWRRWSAIASEEPGSVPSAFRIARSLRRG